MNGALDVLEFFKNIDTSKISFGHITIAAIATLVVYFFMFLIQKYVQKSDVARISFSDLLIKFGVAFIVEFGLIWIYGPPILILAVVVGLMVALYVRNKLFSFIDTAAVADTDLQMRVELAELKSKFSKNPYYSILEVLLYYGYISTIQKETVEAENIFKTPDEMAKEFLSKPILTMEQLDEAIGIMNVIRREGKILTREEALLLIMNRKSDGDSKSKENDVGV